jgi:hypothetical protein
MSTLIFIPLAHWNKTPWGCYLHSFYSYLISTINQCLSPLLLWVWALFMARRARYNIMWSSLSVTSDRSMVFSGYSGFLQFINGSYNIILRISLVRHNSMVGNQTSNPVIRMTKSTEKNICILLALLIVSRS